MEAVTIERELISLDNTYMETVTIELLHKHSRIPTYAHDGDSGMDVYAIEDFVIRPGEVKTVKLGFKMAIPKHPRHSEGYRWECQVRPRSGVSSRTGLIVILGTIDNTYTGEVGVTLRNINQPKYYISVNKTSLPYLPAADIAESHDMSTLNLLEEKVTTKQNYPVGTYLIRRGERFAQMVFGEILRPIRLIVGEVPDAEDRGDKGFGATGILVVDAGAPNQVEYLSPSEVKRIQVEAVQKRKTLRLNVEDNCFA